MIDRCTRGRQKKKPKNKTKPNKTTTTKKSWQKHFEMVEREKSI